MGTGTLPVHGSRSRPIQGFGAVAITSLNARAGPGTHGTGVTCCSSRRPVPASGNEQPGRDPAGLHPGHSAAVLVQRTRPRSLRGAWAHCHGVRTWLDAPFAAEDAGRSGGVGYLQRQRPEPVAACREVANGIACNLLRRRTRPPAADAGGPGPAGGPAARRSSLLYLPEVVGPRAPSSPGCAQRGKQKARKVSREFFPGSVGLGESRSGEVDRVARGKGSGHLMDRSYQPPKPPTVPPNGPGLRRSGVRARRIGAAAESALSRRPAARSGTGRSPGKTRPSRRRYRSTAWFMSAVSRSRGSGRRRCRRRFGPRVRGADRILAVPLCRSLDLAIALERPRRRRELIAAGRSRGGRRSGAVRGSRGRPPLRHELLELGHHGRPDDADQLVASCREIVPVRRIRMLAFRSSVHPAARP